MKPINKDIYKNLFLITAEYPYGKGETFIENELRELSKKFDTIYLIPISKSTDTNRFIPENAQVVDTLALHSTTKISATFTRNFLYIIQILFSEFIHTNKKKYFIKNIREVNNFLCQNIQRTDCIQAFINKQTKIDSNNLFYSFWMNEGATIYAILKDRKIINNFVFRVSGYDLYDERREGHYMPFRYFNISRAKQVFCVSKGGMEYLKSKKIFPTRISYSYFGTIDYGTSPFSQITFTIYSCSNIIPVKRVELIVEILKNISFEIKWIHRGHGILKNQLLDSIKSLPPNVTFELLEWTKDYNDIMNYVKNNPINLFINVSSSEGLPVTIIEAISFGIPVIATDVGGTNEIVTEKTGILIKKEFDPVEVAKLIQKFKDSPMNTLEFRKGAKDYWKKKFSATKNYELFYDQLTN